MHVKTAERVQAVVATTTARSQNHQTEGYPNSAGASRAKNLTQAADVLCLLAFFPLSETARLGFTALFERRLRRAYEGVTR